MIAGRLMVYTVNRMEETIAATVYERSLFASRSDDVTPSIRAMVLSRAWP